MYVWNVGELVNLCLYLWYIGDKQSYVEFVHLVHHRIGVIIYELVFLMHNRICVIVYELACVVHHRIGVIVFKLVCLVR